MEALEQQSKELAGFKGWLEKFASWLLDVLREGSTEVESYHSVLDASLIAHQLQDLRVSEGDQVVLYLRNLPDKVQKFAQLHGGATTVAKLGKAPCSHEDDRRH